MFTIWIATRSVSRGGRFKGVAAQFFQGSAAVVGGSDELHPKLDRQAARALHHRLRHFQNEYRNQRWGPVRIIHNWTLIPAVWVDGADDPASYSILE